MSDKVHLDLNSLERPDRAEPFTIELGPRTYTLIDVKDVDYRELIEAYQAFSARQDPELLIHAVIPEADREEFFANHLPGWRLEALFDAYNRHHGLDPGEASASPSS